MRYLLLIIFLFIDLRDSKAQLYDNGRLFINGNFIVAPITIAPVGGNLTFLAQNLQFNGSVLTFLGD